MTSPFNEVSYDFRENGALYRLPDTGEWVDKGEAVTKWPNAVWLNVTTYSDPVCKFIFGFNDYSQETTP
jgi:hypothetical protein